MIETLALLFIVFIIVSALAHNRAGEFAAILLTISLGLAIFANFHTIAPFFLAHYLYFIIGVLTYFVLGGLYSIRLFHKYSVERVEELRERWNAYPHLSEKYSGDFKKYCREIFWEQQQLEKRIPSWISMWPFYLSGNLVSFLCKDLIYEFGKLIAEGLKNIYRKIAESVINNVKE